MPPLGGEYIQADKDARRHLTLQSFQVRKRRPPLGPTWMRPGGHDLGREARGRRRPRVVR